MGAEAKCTVRIKGKSASGTARLETEVVQFRGRSTGSRSARASSRAGGDLKLSIPFKTMTRVVAKDGKLTAAKWADKILHPPSRLDKIGVKSEWRASAIGVDDETFLTELARAVAVLSIGRVQSDSDAIFYGVTKDAQLARLEKLKAKIKPNGAIWVIRPKGRPEISERAVMAAGKGAGLVDVKVVGFSATHTAEKFVIPVAKR
jgi:hypothetical protein